MLKPPKPDKIIIKGRRKLIHAAFHRATDSPHGETVNAICGAKKARWSDAGAYFWNNVNCPGCCLAIVELFKSRYRRYRKIPKWVELEGWAKKKTKRSKGFWRKS